ncbi:MAG: hypothetical protein GY710_23820 [Desulfobacteraceae bacterium]|nr:hypothetical protein [Desulfobacteraceae bacterium]
MLPSFLFAQGDEFTKYEMSFKNFLTCELTRTGAINHFEGKAFKITMIDLFSIQRESGMVILTGAVRCAVEGRYFVLYAALGVEAILDKEKVSYYTIRKKDFSILVTGLIRFPYKERCPWSRYWVDTD